MNTMKPILRSMGTVGLMIAVLSLTMFVSCSEEEDPKAPSPIASFQYTISTTNFLEVTFTNFSQNAVSYSWDFGDNTTSTEESPVHLYSAVGTYTVKLSATNEDGETIIKEDDITLVDPDAFLTLLAGTVSKMTAAVSSSRAAESAGMSLKGT